MNRLVYVAICVLPFAVATPIHFDPYLSVLCLDNVSLFFRFVCVCACVCVSVCACVCSCVLVFLSASSSAHLRCFPVTHLCPPTANTHTPNQLYKTALRTISITGDYAHANSDAVAALEAAAANGTAYVGSFSNGTTALARDCGTVSPATWLCRSQLTLPGRDDVAVDVQECLPQACSTVSDRSLLYDQADVSMSAVTRLPLVRRHLVCPHGGLLTAHTTTMLALCTTAVTLAFLVVLMAFFTKWPASAGDQPHAGDRMEARTARAARPRAPWWKAWDPVANLKSLVTSGPLAPLDGLRSLAVLWVVSFHTLIELNNNSFYTHTWGFVSSGDMGVDVFFALSGFLMAFVLLGRNPGVDPVSGRPWSGYFNAVKATRPVRFLFRRWVRLTPAYVVALIASAASGFPGIAPTCRRIWWHNLLFVNNMVHPGLLGCIAQSWSIAVEAQFYVISPFIVVCVWMWPWVTVVTVSLCSTALRAYLLLYLAGTSENFTHNLADGFSSVYTPLYTRVAPYVCGMLACVLLKKEQQRLKQLRSRPPQQLHRVTAADGAHHHQHHRPAAVLAEPLLAHTHSHDEEEGAPTTSPPPAYPRWALEVLAFVAIGVWVALSYLGVMGNANTALQWGIHYSWAMYVVMVFGRGVFGVAVCTAMWLMLRPSPDGTKSLLASGLSYFLSLRLHVPIARLSYSTYLLQFLVFAQPWFGPGPQAYTPDTDYTTSDYFTAVLQILCTLVTVNFLAFCTYMVVEKPFMNLRQ